MDLPKVLITGGAGYIGTHLLKVLHPYYDLIVVDDLSLGNRDLVQWGHFIQGSVLDPLFLSALFSKYSFYAVLHLAAEIGVSESFISPAQYYRSNVQASLNLLDCMIKHEVRRMVFSSSAAVYGLPQQKRISESDPSCPLSPYGKTKWMIEEVLKDYDKAYGLKSVCLRYFNVAGADPGGQLGSRRRYETHLIPLLCQAALKHQSSFSVYGKQYATPDGTAIRDYIHVMDVCHANRLALDFLSERSESLICNIGSGHGYSINEVLAVFESVTGVKFDRRYEPARQGDAELLVSDNALAKMKLDWMPGLSNLDKIIQDHWNWEKQVLLTI